MFPGLSDREMQYLAVRQTDQSDAVYYFISKERKDLAFPWYSSSEFNFPAILIVINTLTASCTTGGLY